MTAPVTWWPEPSAGDIVWCRFPDHLGSPQPKPRPALVLVVYDDDAPEFYVDVAYGTSQKTDQLYPGEMVITSADGAAYRQAGLSYDTKFDLCRVVQLAYNDQCFMPPPAAPHGLIPKLGSLHPSKVKDAGRAKSKCK
jgi:hypothetical protein